MLLLLCPVESGLEIERKSKSRESECMGYVKAVIHFGGEGEGHFSTRTGEGLQCAERAAPCRVTTSE